MKREIVLQKVVGLLMIILSLFLLHTTYGNEDAGGIVLAMVLGLFLFFINKPIAELR